MSPRRAELLTQIGVEFSVVAADIDESVLFEESGADYVSRLALAKAQTIASQHLNSSVLAADTCIVFDGVILGKPKDAEHARQMLTQLSGQTHQVMTAIAMVCGDHRQVRLSISEVTMAAISNQAMSRYLDSKESMDKAGSYAIQGFAAVFIERLEGSYSSVMGLPLYETAELLRQFDVDYWLVDA